MPDSRRVIRIGCADRRELPEADRAAIAMKFDVRPRDVFTPSLFGAVQELVDDDALREAFFRNLQKGIDVSGATAIVVAGHEGCALIEDDLEQMGYMDRLARLISERFGLEIHVLWEISQGKDKGWDPCWFGVIPALADNSGQA